jgi:ATP-dependent 26S proteasome regulatory subunit
MVVLEDVDLVARERMFDDSGPVLFELLNQMDGLAPDMDVIFLLTTNRPDILEPALAARPGRIDQAVELPLPDADGLRRLIELYSTGLEVRAGDLDAVVDRLEGATPAHVKELLRKAAVLAAEEVSDGPIVVEDRHLDEALGELVVDIERIKQRLFEADGPGEDDFPFPPDVEVDDY